MSWRQWTMPESIRNLLAVNSVGCIRQPHTKRDSGLYLDVYRLNAARKNGRISVMGTFRVDNVPEAELLEQIQRLIHWVNGVI